MGCTESLHLCIPDSQYSIIIEIQDCATQVPPVSHFKQLYIKHNDHNENVFSFGFFDFAYQQG